MIRNDDDSDDGGDDDDNDDDDDDDDDVFEPSHTQARTVKSLQVRTVWVYVDRLGVG